MTLKQHGCRQAARLISKRCDTRLAMGEQLRLRFHLMLCGNCTRFAQQTALLQQASGRWRAYRDSGQADASEHDAGQAPGSGP